MKYAPYAIISVLVVALIIVLLNDDEVVPDETKIVLDSLQDVIVLARDQQKRDSLAIDSLRSVELERKREIDALYARTTSMKKELERIRKEVQYVSADTLLRDLNDILATDVRTLSKGSGPPGQVR